MADCSCILCNESAEGLKNKLIKLTDKGSRGIRKASKERGESVDAKEGDYVHEKCRRDYCLKQNIDRAKKTEFECYARNPQAIGPCCGKYFQI